MELLEGEKNLGVIPMFKRPSGRSGKRTILTFKNTKQEVSIITGQYALVDTERPFEIWWPNEEYPQTYMTAKQALTKLMKLVKTLGPFKVVNPNTRIEE